MSTRSKAGEELGRWVAFAGVWVGLTTFGYLAEQGARPQATDRALTTLLLTVLPLAIAFSVGRMRKVPEPFVACGEDRRKVTARAFAPLVLGWPLTSAVLAFILIAWTRTTGDAGVVRDVAATVPVAFMAAVALVLACLAASAWLGRFGLVGLVVLLYTLGRVDALASAVLPLAHVRHLLGVGVALPFDPGWSMGALWGFSLLGAWAWRARVPR